MIFKSIMVTCITAGICPLLAQAEGDVYYGEPVQLHSRFVYFTSWKYVRPGSFTWRTQYDADTPEAEKAKDAGMKGDGTKPALFDLMDMPRGIRLVAQKCEKVPFAAGQMAADVYDQGKYKVWYNIDPCPEPEPYSTKDKIPPGFDQHIAYAESLDGVHWSKPDLSLIEYAGNAQNNIVFRGDLEGSTRGLHNGSVFVDPSSRDEPYKMIYLGIITEDEWNAFAKKYPGEIDTKARRADVSGRRMVNAVFGAASMDGIHWRTLPEPLMIQQAESINNCYYDVELKKYVAYVRVWEVNPKAPGTESQNIDSWYSIGRRAIGRCYSSDFQHFSVPETVFAAGADLPPNQVWYTNCKTTLPGCPDNHVMFPWLWETESDGGSVWLLSSPDGRYWSKVPGGPVVEPGPLGGPDGGCVIGTHLLVEYPGDKWAIGYSGSVIPHKYPGRDLARRKGLFPGAQAAEGLAVWPRGRLVALQCDDEGQFATVAIVPPGEHIRLNASIRPTGYLKVAVHRYGASGDIPGRSFEEADHMIGDGLNMPVTWKGEADLKRENAPVILRFQLRQAKLFGIEFY